MHMKDFGKTLLMTAVAIIVINKGKQYLPASVQSLFN